MAPDVASSLARLGDRENWVGDDHLVFVGTAGGYLDGSAIAGATGPRWRGPPSASSASTTCATRSAPA